MQTNKEQNLNTPGNEKEQAKELNMDALEAASGGYTTYSDPGRALSKSKYTANQRVRYTGGEGTITDIQIASGDSGFYSIYQINGNWYTADAITGKV